MRPPPYSKQPLAAPPVTGSGDWHACDDPVPMLKAIADCTSRRKIHLFACAVLRSASHDSLLDRAADFGERLADGIVAEGGKEARQLQGEMHNHVFFRSWRMPHRHALPLISQTYTCQPPEEYLRAVTELCQFLRWRDQGSHARLMADLLREIVGDPYAPATVRTEWLIAENRLVPRLAHAIHVERRFHDAPYLADALSDVGCDSGPLVEHLRGPGPHVAGCWAIDLLAGGW